MGSFLSHIDEICLVIEDTEPELRQQADATDEDTSRQNNHSSSLGGDSNPNPQPSTNTVSHAEDARHQPSTSSGKTYGEVTPATWLPPYQEGEYNLRGSDVVVEGEMENESNVEQNEDGHEGNEGESNGNNEANRNPETISSPDAASASQLQNNEANVAGPNAKQNGNDNDGGETCSPLRRSKRTMKETCFYEAGPIRAPRRRK